MDNRLIMVAVSVIIAVTITAGALVPIIADVSNNEGGGGTPVTYGEQGDLELGLFDSTYSVNLSYSTYDDDDSGRYTCTLDSVNGESIETESIKFTPNQIIFASTTCTLYAHTTTDNNYIEFSVGFISTYDDRYDSNTGMDNTYVYYDAGEDYLSMDLGGDSYHPKSGTTWYIRPVFSVDGPNTGLIQRGIYNYANGSAYIGESDSLPITFCAIDSNKEIVTAQASVGSEVSVQIGDDWETATVNYSYGNENGIVSDLVVTATVSDPATVIEYPATYILGLADHPTGGGEGGGSDVPSSITTVLSVIPLLVVVGIVLMVIGAYRKQ